MANVKNLTGGDTIAARALYSPHVEEFKPSHTLVLLTNHLPKASSDEYAFWKRVQAIPFKLSFVDNPQAEHERPIDKDLPAKLENEYSGILNWIIQGAAAWQKEGLGEMPASVESATKEYQRSEDILQDFLDECCTEQRGVLTRNKILYGAYSEWCKGMNMRAMSSIAFSKSLKDKGFQYVEPHKTLHFVGLALTSD